MEVAAEGGDDIIVFAPLVAVGRIDELEVEAFVRQLIDGKGAAEHGEKYEAGGMNDEGFDFDFLESVVKLAGGGSEWFHKMGEIMKGAGAGAKRGNRREDSRDQSRRGDRLGRWRGRR